MKLTNKKLMCAVILVALVLIFSSAIALPSTFWYERIDGYRDICVHEAYAIITYKLNKTQLMILDVRTTTEFEGGYIAGAINIPHDELEANLTNPATCPLAGHEDDIILVYCKVGGRSAIAAEILATHRDPPQVGQFNHVYNMVGGTTQWASAPWSYPLVTEAPPTYTDIDVHEAKAMIDNDATYPNLMIVDVRTPTEYDVQHIEGAINIPYYNDADFGTKLGPLVGHENDEIIVYCQNNACTKGPLASQYLVDHGFTKVYHMLGGLDAWGAAGYPTVGSGGFRITLSASLGGTTDPEPGVHTYASGQLVTLTAIADPGYVFDHWESGVSGQFYSSDNPWSFNMPSYHFTVRAVFVAAP